MSRFPEACLLLALLAGPTGSAALAGEKYPGIGRVATPAEVAAWDTDVRADFKGLPPGSGSVAAGQRVWEAKCESCHGVFGESNQVFSPIIGGTTADDVRSGRVARLQDPAYPARTTLMKLATLSTLWDYINRAMPWNQPKSLSKDEVYAVTAYLLHLGNVVPDNFSLSDRNMAEVQNRLPNRNGMTTTHALWPGREFGGKGGPDIRAVACMHNCTGDATVTSFLPDFARNQHGNLAEQNRPVGAQRGADTSQPEAGAGAPVAGGKTVAVAIVAAPQPTAQSTSAAPQPQGAGIDNRAALALATKYSCTACHGLNQKIVGPAFTEVARKHAGKVDYLAGKIKTGGAGVWGLIPMPPQGVSETEARLIASWIAAGAAK